jgi:hypothetical protein
MPAGGVHGERDLGRAAARWWYVVLALVVTAAFVTQLVLLFTTGADVNTSSSGAGESIATRLIRLFSYFTIESNLIVLAAAVTLIRDPQRDGRLWRVLRLDSLLGIVITGLVFDLVLASKIHLTGAAWWATLGFHYFSPWWTLLGWVLFGPRPRVSRATAVAAFAWPLAWIGYTFAHGAVSGWYPYPFLDAATIGYAHALRNTAVIFVFAVLLAVLFTLLDRVRTVDRAPAGAARAGRTGRPRSRAGSQTG